MDEATRKKWMEEANKILKERIKYMQVYYPAVRDAYQNHYDWPNLDTLRDEISVCVMLGLFQAAITLTNHFMESLLKNALITKESKVKAPDDAVVKGQVIDSLVNHFADAIKKYDNADLSNNINQACSLGLITKKQKKQLHAFRKQFRNAYGHSDKNKTFGDLTVPMKGIQLENDMLRLDQEAKPFVAALPIGQSIIQAMQAKAYAPDYFLYMDNLTRQIRVKLFGPIKSE